MQGCASGDRSVAPSAGHAQRRLSWLRYGMVATFFALGLMAKPMLVTLPFVLLLLDYWPLMRVGGKRRGGGQGPRFSEGGGTTWCGAAAVF